jgi:SAM-dependent methyltransferase
VGAQADGLGGRDGLTREGLPEPEPEPEPEPAGVDDPKGSYDLVAADYAAQFKDELVHKPFDRKMLELLAERAATGAAICDLGCGPGQAAGYLHERGHRALGIDLSPGMVREARALFPEVPFQQGDMLDLREVPDAALGGIAALYSIIHVPPERRDRALSEMRRVLLPGAPLLLAFHIGGEVVHRDEWWGKRVCLDFRFLDPAEVQQGLAAVGLEVLESIERSPYPEEYPSRRAYVFARRPALSPADAPG